MFERLIKQIYIENTSLKEIKQEVLHVLQDIDELSHLFQIIIINIQAYSEEVRTNIAFAIEEGKHTLQVYADHRTVLNNRTILIIY
jgi:hypothetical protein